MRTYEQPKLDVIRLEMADMLTSDPAQAFSNIFEYEQDVEEW